ncbi:MAG: hypothetical protein ACN4GG_09675 [Akkermansiaceae bacterium]
MIRFTLLTSLFSLPAFAGDIVALKNGDYFTGKISGLSDGLIQLVSPHSETPLQIVSDELKELTFAPVLASDTPKHRHLVNLRNGDSIPGDVTALDGKAVTLHTWFAGDLVIQRALIESVFFEAAPQRLVYKGPDEITEWQQDSGWSWDDHTYRASGSGNLSRDLQLSEDFIVSFDLSWRNTPSFRFHFCTDAQTGDDNSDGYYLELTSQGFALNRVIPDGGNGKAATQRLGGPITRANEFKMNKVRVEIRVSRSQKTIYFYLNGDYAGQYSDPNPTAPRGTNIIFNSRSSTSRQYTIDAIEIREWDSVTRRLNREKQVEDEADTLATDEGDLFTGVIHSRQVKDGRPFYQMKISLSERPFLIPEDRCSVLYFTKGEPTDPQQSPYQLSLITGGTLSLSEISLGDKSMSAKHPWLGELILDRRVLRDMKTPAKPLKKKLRK